MPHLTFRAASAHSLDCIAAGRHGGASSLDEMSQGVPDAPGATITNHTQRVLPNLRRAGDQVDGRRYSGMRQLQDAPLFGPWAIYAKEHTETFSRRAFPYALVKGICRTRERGGAGQPLGYPARRSHRALPERSAIFLIWSR